MQVAAIILGTLSLAALTVGVPSTGGAQSDAESEAGRLTMTSERLYQDAKGLYNEMTQTLAAHRVLMQRATDSGLVVASDAIKKDYAASRELLSFARDLVADLRRDLGLDQPNASGHVPIADPLVYPQLREIGVLFDQMRQLLKSGEKFMALMEKPTETAVKRLEADAEEPIE